VFHRPSPVHRSAETTAKNYVTNNPVRILFYREGNEESGGGKTMMQSSGVGSSPDVVAMEPRNGGGSVSVGIGDGGGIVNPAFHPPSLLSQQSTVWTRRQQAVCVRHAFKHYGSASKPNHVLSNLNMTVAKGTMLVL